MSGADRRENLPRFTGLSRRRSSSLRPPFRRQFPPPWCLHSLDRSVAKALCTLSSSYERVTTTKTSPPVTLSSRAATSGSGRRRSHHHHHLKPPLLSLFFGRREVDERSCSLARPLPHCAHSGAPSVGPLPCPSTHLPSTLLPRSASHDFCSWLNAFTSSLSTPPAI